MFKLRFIKEDIKLWASKYTYPGEDKVKREISPHVKDLGYFNKEDFIDLCKWKTPRTQPRCKNNTDEYIKEITTLALSTSNKQLQIEILTLLEGVRFPTASAILHFTHKEDYPILDFRALWSLNCEVPKRYTFEFWDTYTIFCRELANESNVSMRVLDRALWQYSKEKQPSKFL